MVEWVFVISKSGKPLMPTKRLGKVRHLLKDGTATIYSRHPFAIQLTYDSEEHTQLWKCARTLDIYT